VKKDLHELIGLLTPRTAAPEAQGRPGLEALSERERAVLEFRYGLKGGEVYSLQAVGEMYGVSGERIRQIEARALGKLRRAARGRKPAGGWVSQAA
jgi:DNA-directed RNA polymerase sigma subunit (sigma70/sigma32)